MRTRTSIVVAALIVSAGIAVTAAPAARTGCTPGPFTKGDSSGVTFCGPARVTATVGGKTYKYTAGGMCTRTSKYVNLNAGTEVLTGPKGKASYFGLLVGAYPGSLPGTKASPKDGTYSGGLVTIRWKGKAYILNGAGDKTVKITLKKGRTAGTFSGTTFLEPKLKVTGSFTC